MFTSDPDIHAGPVPGSGNRLAANSEGGAADSNLTNESSLPIQKEPWRFRPGDVVIVTFSGTTEQILPHEERIKEDGNITLDYVGAVKAVGKTDGELQTEIHDLYVPKFYKRLTVVVKYGSELSYSVLGEVRSPGPKPYLPNTTVTKAIGAASGFTEFASKTDVVLTRANGTQIKINYKKAIKDPKFDPQVFPGDAINVRRSW